MKNQDSQGSAYREAYREMVSSGKGIDEQDRYIYVQSLQALLKTISCFDTAFVKENSTSKQGVYVVDLILFEAGCLALSFMCRIVPVTAPNFIPAVQKRFSDFSEKLLFLSSLDDVIRKRFLLYSSILKSPTVPGKSVAETTLVLLAFTTYAMQERDLYKEDGCPRSNKGGTTSVIDTTVVMDATIKWAGDPCQAFLKEIKSLSCPSDIS